MKTMKRAFCLMLVLAALCSVFALPASAATGGFDILTSSKYAKTYTLATSGSTIPYTGSDLRYRGTVTYGRSNSSYIDNRTDELYILDVGKNSSGTYWAKVKYPAGSKRVTAYIALSAITENNGSHVARVSSGKFLCATRKDWGNSSSYYVAKNDTVYLVSTSGSRVQILYPISGGLWRLAWANKSDYERYCGPVNPAPANNTGNTTVNTSGMTDVTAYFVGSTIRLRSVQNGQYLCADGNLSQRPAMCNRPSATTWTRFTVSSMTSDGWVGLKANTNGRYLTANLNVKDAPLQASAQRVQKWECFRIYMKGNDFYLLSQANNKWLCVRVDQSGAPLQAYANGASTWERMTITFCDTNHMVSVAELVKTAVENGISPNSNAWKALCSVNTKYAGRLTASQKKGTNVFFFEGVGSSSASGKRMNAMCLVVKNGDIVYLNRNSSTIPDYPFDPAKNEWTNMPTLKSGIYNFTTVNHRGSYAALNVSNAQVVRHASRSSYYSSTSSGINVHRRSTNSIAGANAGWVNSAGCLLVGQSGTGSSNEYARFIQAVGIVGGSASGTARYSSYRTGTIIVDRAYAYDYLRSVGYSTGAISLLG